MLFKFGLGTDIDLAAAGHVGFVNAGGAVNGGIGREIRAFDEIHKLRNVAVRVVHEVNDAVNDLIHVVRRNVGGHTDGNTDRAVDEQIRKTCRKHGRFF